MRRAVQSCNAGVSAADLGSAAARGICHTQAGRYRAAVAIAHCHAGRLEPEGCRAERPLRADSAKLGQDGQDFSLPPKRQIYALPDKTLIRDSTRPDFQLPDEAAQNAYDYAGLVDDYFRSLSAQGVGAWDGCYGKAMRPIMPSYVHLSPEFRITRIGGLGMATPMPVTTRISAWRRTWRCTSGRTRWLVEQSTWSLTEVLNNQTGGLYESLG